MTQTIPLPDPTRHVIAPRALLERLEELLGEHYALFVPRRTTRFVSKHPPRTEYRPRCSRPMRGTRATRPRFRLRRVRRRTARRLRRAARDASDPHPEPQPPQLKETQCLLSRPTTPHPPFETICPFKPTAPRSLPP